MKYEILHQLPPSQKHGWRLRLRHKDLHTARIARGMARQLEEMPGISKVQVNHHTKSVLFHANTQADRDAALELLEHGFNVREHTRISAEEVEELLTGEKPAGALIGIARYFLLRPLLPFPLRVIISTASAVPFIIKGLRSLFRGKLNVDVLDAAALTVSILTRDFNTVGMLTMLLATGEALEVWTRQRSLASLGESLALKVDRVWLVDADGNEYTVPLAKVQPGDLVIINAGSSIPVDGIVESGSALVNQAAMTGEPIPVMREHGGAVFAGTIVESGKLVIRVSKVGEGTRLQQVISFIERSEAEKSNIEARYLRLADKAAPLTFALAGLVFLVTRNLMRAASVLLVDYSCALKLATPLAVLSAMRNGTQKGIAIRGGRYLEALQEADTLVFDKTGTLTSAHPALVDVYAAPGWDRREILRLMACLEEHFPHPVSRAIVQAAERENLQHNEEHAEVSYVVAHGIASSLNGHSLLLGSRHYLEHDEGVDLSWFDEASAREAAQGRSLLFLSEEGKGIGMAVIEDPLRPEAAEVVKTMRSLGIKHILMLTGDDQRTARAVAAKVGINEYHAQILPNDKGRIIQELNAAGRKVMMVGDGINDGPALSSASVGVAMCDGADLARAVANVLLMQPNLDGLISARLLASHALSRIRLNVNMAIGLNSAYLLGAIIGIFPPGLTAVLHNLTTLGIAFNAIRPYSYRLPSANPAECKQKQTEI